MTLAVRDTWQADETYIEVLGQWMYLYRAVDKEGRIVEFRLGRRRDGMAVKQPLRTAALNRHAEFMNPLALSRYCKCLIAFAMEPIKQSTEQGPNTKGRPHSIPAVLARPMLIYIDGK